MITKEVKKPVLNITVIGKKKMALHEEFHKYSAGQDLIMTKWAGVAGTAILAEKEQETLEKRLPSYIVENGIELKNYVSVLPVNIMI